VFRESSSPSNHSQNDQPEGGLSSKAALRGRPGWRL
jgi:hypothetical protein